MALIVRCPWTGKPLRAIEVAKDPEELKPLFYCDLKHALLHSTFRRIVLRKALNIKFDGRTFSGLLRELDPRLTGYITYSAFARLLRSDERRAFQLGLPLVAANHGAGYGHGATTCKSEGNLKSPKRRTGRFAASSTGLGDTGSSSLGVGVTQRRLRKELARTLSETALAKERAEREAKEARGSGVRAVRSRKKKPMSDKPRRPLLRHELTELRGAGILLVEPTRTHPPITEAQVAWQNPKTNNGQAIGRPVAWRARTPGATTPPPSSRR